MNFRFLTERTENYELSKTLENLRTRMNRYHDFSAWQRQCEKIPDF